MTENDDSGEHRVTTDPRTAEKWAAEHDVVPVVVPGEELEVHILPREQAEETDQERLEWSQFRERFDRGGFALVDRGEREEGERYDLIDRDEVAEPETPGREPAPEPDESADSEATKPTGAETSGQVKTEMDEPAPTDEPSGAGRGDQGGTGSDRTVPRPRDQGKDVIDASGERIGMVADVRGRTLYVDPHPSLTGRIKAALDWGEMDEAAFPVQSEKIRRIYNDVVLDVERPDEEL